MPGKRILVVDEDAARRKLNVFGMRCAGFSVDEATDACSARSRIAADYPDLVLIVAALLDFGIQDFVRTLRSDSCTHELPIVALIERESELGAATALAWGLDDYLLEPISPEEFIARVRATLECGARTAAPAGEIAGLSLDGECGVLRRGTRSVPLGPTERRVLEFFLTHPEQLIPRDLLLFRIWGGGANLHSRVVDVSVCRLRRALGQLGCGGLLKTVSRHGYRLAAGAEAAGAEEADARGTAVPARNTTVTLTSSNARRA